MEKEIRKIARREGVRVGVRACVCVPVCVSVGATTSSAILSIFGLMPCISVYGLGLCVE